MRHVLTVLLALLAIAGGALAWQHNRIKGLDAGLIQAQTQAVIAAFETSAARTDVQIVTRYADRERAVRQVIHDIQRETPRYVTPDSDTAFPLPVGFVRLHDAAAAAILPGAPGPHDAQASTVEASDAAIVIAGNYGTCHAIREQLNALIDRLQTPPYTGGASHE